MRDPARIPCAPAPEFLAILRAVPDRKSTRLNSSHSQISYAVFCLKKKILPHTVHEDTTRCMEGTPDEKLKARACGLVFLINKRAAANDEIGIKTTDHTIANVLFAD